MKKKQLIICIALLVSSSNAFAKTISNWKNEIYAEHNKYSYTASMNQEENEIEYKCSVIKFNKSKFAMLSNLNIDINLRLETENLNLQDSYKINFIFPNGEIYDYNLGLRVGKNNLDRFTIFLDYKKPKDYNIISNLLNRNNVNIEIIDNKNKKSTFRFYLSGSKKAIDRTKTLCETLYLTFK